jgi:oligopeptide/dipeptide ABC transporter ATP-binding protein
MTLLDVHNLSVEYETADTVHAVNDINFELDEESIVGIVGESGSGKSTFLRAINRILANNANITSGSVIYKGTDLTELTPKELRQYLWREIAMIPQSAMNALDPVYTIEDQIIEVIQAHEDATEDEARGRAQDLFEMVNLDPERLTDYPHQLSGGMRQRAMIALALALDPDILLADEPTTALDVIIQRQILNRIAQLQEEIGLSIILVTHDISVVAETCDKVGVFYGGSLVEYSDTRDVIKDPHHPYTMGLKNSFPTIIADEQELVSIPGKPPDLHEIRQGCIFTDRCPFAEEECHQYDPDHREVKEEHFVECHRADEADALQQEAKNPQIWSTEQ